MAVKCWQWGILLPISVIAVTTYSATYVSFEMSNWLKLLPEWIVDHEWVKAKASDLSKILVGILNTFVAALWLDGAKKPTGKLWPSGQIKSAFETEFRDEINKLKKVGRDHLELENAVTGEMVRDSVDPTASAITGWDYPALVGRARIIERITQTQESAN